MLERGSGKIMNVASTAGFQPGPLMAVYYATKAYVISFSEALANELAGKGVTVTCLCPGATETGVRRPRGQRPVALVQEASPHGGEDRGSRRLSWIAQRQDHGDSGIPQLAGRRIGTFLAAKMVTAISRWVSEKVE